jgi:protein TonB
MAPLTSARSEPIGSEVPPGDDSGGGGDPSEGIVGIPGGTGAGAGGTGAGETPPIPVGGAVREPRLIRRVEPVYPDTALKIRAQGVVLLEAIITTDGRVEQIRVVRSPNPLLSESALAAVAQWRYLPATLNGQSVRVFLTVAVEFKLR